MIHRKLFLIVIIIFYGLLSAAASQAQCSALVSTGLMHSGTIGLVSDGSLNPKVIKEAIAVWKLCDNYGVGFPAFKLGSAGTTRTILIRYQRVRHSPGRRKRCGWFTGNTITLFGYVFSANGKMHHCGTLSRNLAHELGHVVGLLDSPDDLACSLHIMSDLDSANRYGRSVREDECRILEQRWIMPFRPASVAPPKISGERGVTSIDALRRSSPRALEQ